ncbi:hypothetical protein THAOC_21639, partial [Thalassiosira oceanica]
MVSADYQTAITHAAHYPTLRERMMEKFDWTPSDLYEVAPDIKDASQLFQHWKPTRKVWLRSGCPSCAEPLETQLHLYRCTAPAMRASLTESLQQMEETLLRKHIPNIVVRHFMHLVRETCNLPTREYDVHCALCAQACEAQASLGTEAILQGYLVK